MAAAAIEPRRRRGRDREPRADFCAWTCARPRAPGRNAGGKAEVILDLAARPRLAAGRGRFDDQRVEPFGRGIDRRRQPRRPCPDDDQIVQPLLVDRDRDAERIGETVRARVPQDLLFGNHHRQVAIAEAETLQKRRRIGIGR